MTVTQADNTLIAIRKKVRRLTASASESALKTAEIDEKINDAYTNNFPNAIKSDLLRSVYTFYTAPNIDRYPLNVQYNQGVRDPVYVDGVQGAFYKDRNQFYNVWPRWPTLNKPASGDGVKQVFSWTIPQVPFLSKEVTIGAVDVSGAPIRISDDGNGKLLLDLPNGVTYVPPYTQALPTPPAALAPSIPGMHNANTGNPGDLVQVIIGTVNYVTGAMAFSLVGTPYIPAAGTQLTCFVSQYTTGRPYAVMFWNNEFTIRPIPKLTHKIEVETYLTPVQFMATTDSPILNQWWKWLSIMASILILEDRQDLAGIANLAQSLDREQDLILERQATEEINQRNATIFSSAVPALGWNQGWSQGGW
jgi:hypothetical protein